ncbi:MAG: hypothetical protein WCH62_04110 [Candidatus Omnitrophota bacterium]
MKKNPIDPSAALKRHLALLDKSNNLKELENRIKVLEDRIETKNEKISELKEKLKVKQFPNARIIMANEKVNQIIEQYNSGKGGRPPVLFPDEITLQRIADMAYLNASEAEMSACLGVNQGTFIEFKKNNPEVAQLMESAANEGKLSLRRTQFKMAENNTQMAIFLGKNLLNQSEKISSENNVNVNVLKSLMDLTDQEVFDTTATIVDTKSSKVSKNSSNDLDDDGDEEN